jgi:hypothetical protein
MPRKADGSTARRPFMVRLNDAEREALCAKAAARGMKPSAYVRWLVDHDLEHCVVRGMTAFDKSEYDETIGIREKDEEE